MIKEDAVDFISQFSIYQYAFLVPDEEFFSPSVVKECKKCKYYHTSWSCPPAIVRFEKCRRECMSYDEIFVFSSLYGAENDSDGQLKRNAKKEHEKITDFTEELFKSRGYETYVLTSDRCTICEKCTFPRKECLYQDRMHPCIESHGIRMSDLLARCEMDCFFEEGPSLLFSLIFYRRIQEPEGVKRKNAGSNR